MDRERDFVIRLCLWLGYVLVAVAFEISFKLGVAVAALAFATWAIPSTLRWQRRRDRLRGIVPPQQAFDVITKDPPDQA